MSERECLIDFHKATDGRWWYTKWNWASPEVRFSQWFGITVDQGGHIKILNLRENHLRGSIESLKKLYTLVNLQLLCLSTNLLTGRIPRNIGDLQSLQELDLSWNQFSGTLPDSLFTLKLLRVLRLDHNHLEGEIASDRLGELQELVSANFSFNKFTGMVPKAAHKLPNLKMVDFSNNSFTEGPIVTLLREFIDWSNSSEKPFASIDCAQEMPANG